MQNPQQILAKYIWYALKGSHTTVNCNLFQGFKGGSISANQSMWYITLTKWRINNHTWSSQYIKKKAPDKI